MPKLFVDCDDTLVLWRTELNEATGLYKTDGYDLNRKLILNVKAFLRSHPEYDLVVWSGGGISYAAHWAEECFPDMTWMVIAKLMSVPQDGDVVVDDMDVAAKGIVVGPDGLEYCPLCESEGEG